MVTRLYYRFDGIGPPLSTYSSLWSAPLAAPVTFAGKLSATKSTTQSMPRYDTLGLWTATSPVDPTDVPEMAFVSAPLTAQSISGTFKGQVRAVEGGTGTFNAVAQIKVYLIDGTTGAIKSTLYGGYTGALASEFFTSNLTNRKMPLGGSVALTSQTAVAGDRILVILGARFYALAGVSYQLALISASSTDLPEDETTTTASMPWLEFSQNISFSTDTDWPVTFFENARASDNPGMRTPAIQIQAEFEFLDTWRVRYEDVRFLWGEQDSADGPDVVPTHYQIWPRGNRGSVPST